MATARNCSSWLIPHSTACRCRYTSRSNAGELVRRDRDRRLDPTSPQIGPVRARTIGLVRQNPTRPRPRPAGTRSRHPDRVHSSELRTVTALTGSEHQRQRTSILLARQMQFRGPTSPRATESVVLGFGLCAAGRLGLLVTVAAGAGGGLMRPHDGRIDADAPDDAAGCVGHGLQCGQDPSPHPAALPAAEQDLDGLPGPGSVRDVPPRRTDTDAPSDSVDELPFRPLRWTTGLLRAGQQRSQPSPLRVGQVRSPGTATLGTRSPRYSGFAWSLNPDTGGLTHSTTATPLPGGTRFKVTFETRPSDPRQPWRRRCRAARSSPSEYRARPRRGPGPGRACG